MPKCNYYHTCELPFSSSLSAVTQAKPTFVFEGFDSTFLASQPYVDASEALGEMVSAYAMDNRSVLVKLLHIIATVRGS